MTHDASQRDGPDPHPISKTALWVAGARAVGAREPDPRARNPDHLAERLLGAPSALDFDHPIVEALGSSYEEAMQNFETAGLVRAMIERTRFIDEALERAIAAGATQVLIPGVGLDSHAYRFGELLSSARVFEVDRPATLDFKQRRVADALGAAPPNVAYVPVDLEREAMSDALMRRGYDTSKRTFVIMEGLTMYVEEEPLRAVFRFIASHASGTSVVFDFAARAMIDGIAHIDLSTVPPAAKPSMERFLALIRDEPWVFGMPAGGEREFLAETGLELRELLRIGTEESASRYLRRADGTMVGAAAQAAAEALRRAAEARLAEQMGEADRAKLEARLREQRQNAYAIAEAVVP